MSRDIRANILLYVPGCVEPGMGGFFHNKNVGREAVVNPVETDPVRK